MRIKNFGEETSVETPMIMEVEESKNENQFFDFDKAKVQSLTLDQLRRTNKENRGDDRSCPHGIYHYAMIEKIMDMCEQHGYHSKVYDLFATNNKDKQTPGVSIYPELEKKYGERAVEAHTLRRVYANIRITNFDTEEMTTNLAVSYTQKGLQVGFGRNVQICHNQCMMGTGQFVSDYSVNGHYTFGNDLKTDLSGIIDRVGTWLTDAENIIVSDDEKIKKMKESILTAEQLYIILGMLLTIRVAHDTSEKKIHSHNGVYPLNQAQLGKFTESLLMKQHDEGCITAWDFYNCATDLYKPQTAEQGLILPQNMAMVRFMSENEIF